MLDFGVMIEDYVQNMYTDSIGLSILFRAIKCSCRNTKWRTYEKLIILGHRFTVNFSLILTQGIILESNLEKLCVKVRNIIFNPVCISDR